METIRNLIDILESEYVLYQELLQILIQEKKMITEWDTNKIVEVTKIKDTLLYKEKLLEEAREKILQKLDSNKKLTLSDLINKIDNETQKKKLSELQNKISMVATKIQTENFSVKILYNTNMRILNDIFERLGITEKSGYQSQGKIEKKKNNSFVRSA